MNTKFTSFATLLVFFVLVISGLSTGIALSQTRQTPAVIVVTPDTLTAMPDSNNVVLTRSCTPCHSGGNANATSKLDVSKWADYTIQQQVRKGGEICQTMTTGDMPPRQARLAKPELIPTDAQIAMVCKWVSSLKVE